MGSDRAPNAGRLTPWVPVIEIGGTHVLAALVNALDGRVDADSKQTVALDSNAPAREILSRISECARALDAPGAATWGVAIPGPFDYARGIGRFRGVGKFDTLNGVNLRARLTRAVDRQARMVFVNDAEAFGMGEWIAGAAAGHDRAVALTLGTGVGSVFIDGGEVIRDRQDVPPDGSAHLLQIDGHPLEATVSRRAILARYAALSGEAHLDDDVRGIARRAVEDEMARLVFDDAYRALGEALAPWLARFRATILVLGGSISGSWNLVAPPLAMGARTAEPDLAHTLSIVPAALGADAALLGAAAHAARAAELSQNGGGRSGATTGSAAR
jgi:glucokinase